MSLKDLIERRHGNVRDDVLGSYGSPEYSLMYPVNFWTNVAVTVEDYVNSASNPSAKSALQSMYSALKSKVTKESPSSERVNEAVKYFNEVAEGFDKIISNSEKLISRGQKTDGDSGQVDADLQNVPVYNGHATYQLSDRVNKVRALNDLTKDFVKRLNGYRMLVDSGIELRLLDNNQVSIIVQYAAENREYS